MILILANLSSILDVDEYKIITPSGFLLSESQELYMINMHGIIFAYQKTAALKELTEPRATASLPFGSRYRLIDFSLSGMVTAGVRNVGVILQDRYQSLLDHLGSGKDWDLSRRTGGLKLLPPFSAAAEKGYRGDLDALRGVYSYLVRMKEDYVVLAGGDLAANIPFSELYKVHRDSAADITAVCCRASGFSAADDFYFTRDNQGFLQGVRMGGSQNTPESLRSLPVFILSAKLLLEIMDTHTGQNLIHFQDILAENQYKVGLYVFKDYTADMRTIEGYYQSSMALLSPRVRKELFPEARPIRTKDRSDVSTFYCYEAHSQNCIVADGCYIEGDIENCILFRGVRVGKGAKLKNCILMQDTVIGDMAHISYLVADKNVGIAPRTELSGHSLYPLTIAKNSRIGY